ncbi:MaoC family dehydratase N-terminal domain-containing protein [Dongia sp.]|uniref:FAS1-like dehydratase domain-containing protein n=1 Tax=Dongia sp. TaxID=1977262 RepID=UPI0035AE7954
MSLDSIDFTPWIGRSVEETDIITPRLLNEYRVTFDPYLAKLPDQEVPLGFHWCLSPFLVPSNDLGPDGHPAKGGFLPPVPLPRRMWAGGHVDFLAPLRSGDHVRRRSTVASIDFKQGRSGALCFVGVQHEYFSDRGLAISEQHNIVYREAPSSAAKSPEASLPLAMAEPALGGSHESWLIDPTTTMLFRYSAITFNGHRIHYDQPYATAVEGYAGLVVHGPIQATLMLNLAASQRRVPPRHFSYRGLAPLVAGKAFEVRAAFDGEKADCLTRVPGGPINMQGEVKW